MLDRGHWVIHNDGSVSKKTDKDEFVGMTLQTAKGVRDDLNEVIQEVEEMKYEMGDHVCEECDRPLSEDQVEVGLCKTHEKEYEKDARRERAEQSRF